MTVGVDIKKELEEIEKLKQLLIENGTLTKAQMDILAGDVYTKEVLEEFSKVFDEKMKEE